MNQCASSRNAHSALAFNPMGVFSLPSWFWLKVLRESTNVNSLLCFIYLIYFLFLSSRTFHFWCTFRKSLNSFGTITKIKKEQTQNPNQNNEFTSPFVHSFFPSVHVSSLLPNMKQCAILWRIELKLIMNFTK